MNQKEVKEGHEKAIGNQLLRALKLDGKLLALGKLKAGRFGTPLGVPNDQDKLILSRAQWELNDKCLKSYSGDEVWLCIDLQAPLVEISEAEQLADAITLPLRHKFARIYFGFHALFDGNGFTVFVLHPGQRK